MEFRKPVTVYSRILALCLVAFCTSCGSDGGGPAEGIVSEDNPSLYSLEAVDAQYFPNEDWAYNASATDTNTQFFEGDILISGESPPACDLVTPGEVDTDGVSTTSYCVSSIGLRSGARWPRGIIPVLLDDTLPNDPMVDSRRDVIQDAITLIEQQTSLLFPMRTNESNYVRIIASENTDRPRNYSEIVGMKGGEQVVGLLDTSSFGTVLHELLHVAGLFHEHTRSDRDQFVTVNLSSVISGVRGNFTKRSFSQDLTTYDYQSIMHYSQRAFGICSDFTTPVAGICPESSRFMECPSGDLPIVFSTGAVGRCNSVEPKLPVTEEIIKCISSKYGCTSAGLRLTDFVGQPFGLSNLDVAGIRSLYPDGYISLALTLEPEFDPGSFSIFLDGNRLVPEFPMGSFSFDVNQRPVTTGTHQLLVLSSNFRTDIDDYGVTYSGDCSSSGSFVISKRDRHQCNVTISAKSARQACLALCSLQADTCRESQLPRVCAQTSQQCAANCPE